MNKYKYITLKLLLVFVLFGCDDFLDRYPKDSFNTETVFRNETDLKYFVNGLYDSLPWNQYNSDNNSDNMVPNSIDQLLSNSYTVPASGGGWAISDWSGIRRCNFFLNRYDRAETDTSTKERYAGEVRFFRALYYWDKVKRFGNVPVLTVDLDDKSPTLYMPRDPMEKAISLITDDLSFAIEKLPEVALENGRLTKDMARALASRINLWIGTYLKYHTELNLVDQASIYLEKCVLYSSELMAKDYALYDEGETPYLDLFTMKDLSKTKECILNRHFIIGISTHNYTRESSESGTGASKDFMEDYLMIDGSPIPSNFDDATPIKEFKGRDPRMAQTVAVNGYIWEFGETPYTLPQIGSKTSTGYWLIKGRSADKALMVANTDDTDRFIFRYAEVLLNFAEAKYELGTLTNDDLNKSINLIRKRAGLTGMLTLNVSPDTRGIQKYTDVGLLAPSALLYEIRRERRLELIGEGFRMSDIKRWKVGPLVNAPKTVLGLRLSDELIESYRAANVDVSNLKTTDNNLIQLYPSLTDNKRKWLDKMYLYPLPLEQMNFKDDSGKPIYEQNPGWN